MSRTAYERATNGGSAPRLSAEDLARLATQILDIAEHKRGLADHLANGEYRYGRKGSLVIYPSGWWYDFEACKGGYTARQLFAHLGGTDEDLAAWLKDHPGEGRFRPKMREKMRPPRRRIPSALLSSRPCGMAPSPPPEHQVRSTYGAAAFVRGPRCAGC
jgi:hypothetical protein